MGTMMQYFEWNMDCRGQLWNNLKERSKNLANLGITSVWLPPAYKGAFGDKDVGYGVYDLYDLGEFNQKKSIKTKYGSKNEYLNCINELRKNNIEVYADIVLNHRMGADGYQEVPATMVEWDNRNVDIKEEVIKAYTRFTFPARNGKYSDFKWNWEHFDGIDYNYKNKQRAIYKFKDKSWRQDLNTEYGNYDYLMGADIDYGNYEVKTETFKWLLWYLNTTNISGFRLDAVKHIRASFFDETIKKLRDKTNKELFTVGEYWSNNIEELNKYIDQTHGQISLFDVPLHYNLFEASKNMDYDLRNIFENTLTKRFPYLSVTFVDNHDTQPQQALESFICKDFKQIAYSLILLRLEGYPCVFYGDFYGMPYANLEKVKDLDKIISLRANNLGSKQLDYFVQKDLIGWTNFGDNSSFAVIINRSKEEKELKMFVGSNNPNSNFLDMLNNSNRQVLTDNMGDGIFFAKPNSVSIYVKQNL